MEGKLCLQWNDFQDNVKTAFGHLRDTTDFVDVTLASEDGQQIESHKVILAASSPFLAVQDSSISDIVGRSVCRSVWAN